MTTEAKHHYHHYRSPFKRGLLALAFVVVLVTIGTVGMHGLEGMSYLDAFYFTSMIATAQGSAITPQTPGGKIFAAVMAFISVGGVVAALGFLFGPFFGKLWHMGVEHIEEDLHLKKKPHK